MGFNRGTNTSLPCQTHMVPGGIFERSWSGHHPSRTQRDYCCISKNKREGTNSALGSRFTSEEITNVPARSPSNPTSTETRTYLTPTAEYYRKVPAQP